MQCLQYLTSDRDWNQAGKYDPLSEVKLFTRNRHRDGRWQYQHARALKWLEWLFSQHHQDNKGKHTDERNGQYKNSQNETSWNEKYSTRNETCANVINSRLDLAKENVNKPEGKLIETIQMEKQRKKHLKQ